MSYPDKNVKEASSAELMDSLRWQRTLLEHYDENFLFPEYEESKRRIQQIERELDARAFT